jgi:hypothetical protein
MLKLGPLQTSSVPSILIGAVLDKILLNVYRNHLLSLPLFMFFVVVPIFYSATVYAAPCDVHSEIKVIWCACDDQECTPNAENKHTGENCFCSEMKGYCEAIKDLRVQKRIIMEVDARNKLALKFSNKKMILAIYGTPSELKFLTPIDNSVQVDHLTKLASLPSGSKTIYTFAKDVKLTLRNHTFESIGNILKIDGTRIVDDFDGAKIAVDGKVTLHINQLATNEYSEEANINLVDKNDPINSRVVFVTSPMQGEIKYKNYDAKTVDLRADISPKFVGDVTIMVRGHTIDFLGGTLTVDGHVSPTRLVRISEFDNVEFVTHIGTPK